MPHPSAKEELAHMDVAGGVVEYGWSVVEYACLHSAADGDEPHESGGTPRPAEADHPSQQPPSGCC